MPGRTVCNFQLGMICCSIWDTHYASGGLQKRDLGTVLATNHNLTDKGYTLETPADVLFSGLNNSCLLSPEATQGPYCEYFLPGSLMKDRLTGYRCGR